MTVINSSLPIRNTLKQTTSLCPVCLAPIPATVYERDGQVFLAKQCTEHGAFDVLINSDRSHYYLSSGSGCACHEVGASCDSIIEQSSTCIALIEIVESCNLKCPTCFADSPFAPPTAHTYLSLEEFASRVGSVIARKGTIDILQLSGGEPTLHPQFFELLESVLSDQRVGYVLLNTNGVRIAQEPAFAERLGALHRQYRRFEIYLQFDGLQEAGQMALRGADLRRVRQSCIDAMAVYGVPVTLAMTVTPANLDNLGETLRFGLPRVNVRGICFQPMFGSGRVTPARPDAAPAERPEPRLNVADIIRGLIEQGGGLLSTKDFTPLPCGDPNCHTISYLLRRGGTVVPVSQLVDFSSLQGFLKDRADFNIEDLRRCGCESEPLGQLLRQLEIGPDNVFRIFIKPFMDAWTYDQDRIDRCCVHVIGEGGRLESFCRHYAHRGQSPR